MYSLSLREQGHYQYYINNCLVVFVTFVLFVFFVVACTAITSYGFSPLPTSYNPGEISANNEPRKNGQGQFRHERSSSHSNNLWSPDIFFVFFSVIRSRFFILSSTFARELVSDFPVAA